MNEVIFKPRTGEEMQNAIILNNGGKIPILLYSDLCRGFKEYGALKTIKELYRLYGEKMLILLQNPEKMNSGHWMSLTILPRERKIYFFSSYGGKPDEEKNKWLSYLEREKSGQVENVLNDGLKELHMLGWDIHFNDYPYQLDGDNTATCGLWTAAFLNMNMDPDEFCELVIRHQITPYDIYSSFFQKRE